MRKSLLSASLLVGLFILSVSTAPALAAPELAIEMTHANAYGLQASECPTGKEEDFPGEPERDCGVDPFTGSGTTFSQESGFNTYTIRVKNVAAPPSGPTAGTTLTCDEGTWRENPTFEYRWLRDGSVIAGAESNEYTLVVADEGKPVQCEVIGTNATAVDASLSNAIAVAPEPSPAPPSLESGEETEPEVTGEGSKPLPVGRTLTCTPGEWIGNPTFSYQWMRNGAAIAGATNSEYTLVAEDEGASVKCQVAATNAGGTVDATNPYFTYVYHEPVQPTPRPPYYGEGEGSNIPVSVVTNDTTAPVIVADALPKGLIPAQTAGHPAASGHGWTCTVSDSAKGVSCVNATSLAPGELTEPLSLHLWANGEVPLGSPPTGGESNTVAASGGGAPTVAVASDRTTIAPAVPFGIERVTTGVTDAGGDPFTQAGGHPFAANATVVFNHTPEVEGNIWSSGGMPQDIETELPPGFYGSPQNTERCSAAQLGSGREPGEDCSPDSRVGFVTPIVGRAPIEAGRAAPFARASQETVLVYSLEPAPGYAASFGFVVAGSFFTLNAKVRADGNYGVTIGDAHAATIPGTYHGVLAVSLTFCGYGVTGHGAVNGESSTAACAVPVGGSRPFLTAPTRCEGPAPTTTLTADTYQEPADYVSKTVYNGVKLVKGAVSAVESFATGCNLLQFDPEVEFNPSGGREGGTSQAGQPSGSTFDLKVPQTNEAEKSATPELKDATVTLPEGMSADPSAADGLEACTNVQFGLGSTVEPTEPAHCPPGSQVGTVKVVTPLLEKPLEGQVFVGEPECSPCSIADAEQGHLFRLLLQVRLPERGVIVKLAGKVSANPTTGRLEATFTEQPQLPFSELILTLKGGPRAPLANPQTCGSATTTTDFTPWSAPGLGGLSGTESIEGTPDAAPSSTFAVDWDGKGGACPTALPFSPTFLAQTASSAAGQYSPLSVSFGRPEPGSEAEERDEQNLAGISLNMPDGLLGKIAGVEQCAEAAANAGTCSSAAEIGTATVAAGAGSHPYYLSGHVYLTGPYKADPFGLAVAVPAEAGPFRLAGNTGTGLEVVRAGIALNSRTAALTVTSDPLPQIVDGVLLRLHDIRVDVSRSRFTLNPTSCASGQQIAGTITGQPILQGEAAKTVSGSSQFAASGCAGLPFAPSFSASSQAQTSKADGASLRVLVAQKPGEANIAKVDVQLPKQLPARLTTLQKACLAATFESNPAACPAASTVGVAVAHTPLLSSELTGPAILVSHGGAAFPDLEVVLQGEGITLILDGGTDIKKGITYSRFETVPDAPISSFELNLPQSSDSLLATDLPASANSSFCGQNLVMPTTITGQNGKQIIQKTKITTGACTKVKTKVLTRAQKLAKALKACRTKYKAKSKKAKRIKCEKQARKKYGPLHKTKKKAKKSSSRNGKAGR
jgi:hypothetical protein